MGDLFKTKTFWLGLTMIGIGLYQIYQGQSQEGLGQIEAGLALIFGRHALVKMAEQ